MKKHLLAAPLLLSFAGIASAQSSVMLYGIVDAGITYRSNERTGTTGAYSGHSNVAVTSGNLSGSRFGIKGQEDLGGGWNALFLLEDGFDITNGKTGQNGGLFGRQAFVGIGSQQYGTVTLGRQYTSLNDFVAPVAPVAMVGGFGAHPGDIDDLDQTARVNNSVKYTSANYSGFTFGALYGFGGQPGSLKQQNTWSVGAGYGNGPLHVASAMSVRTTARAERRIRRTANGAAPKTACSTRRSMKVTRARNRNRSSPRARPTTSDRPFSA